MISIITTIFLLLMLLLIIIIKVIIIDIIIIIIIIIITIVIMFRTTFWAFPLRGNHLTPIKTSRKDPLITIYLKLFLSYCMDFIQLSKISRTSGEMPTGSRWSGWAQSRLRLVRTQLVTVIKRSDLTFCAENLALNFLIFASHEPSACSSRAYSRLLTDPQLHLPKLIWLTFLPGIAKRPPCSLGVIGVFLERAYHLSYTATQRVISATNRVL